MSRHCLKRPHRPDLGCGAWYRTCRLATSSSDRTARIWDATHCTELGVLRGHQDGVWGVAWSPDGARLATTSFDRTARIWDAASGSELVVLRGHQNTVVSVDWSPD